MPTGGLPAKFSSETSRGEFIQLRELTETGSQAARQPDGRAQVSIGRPAPPKTVQLIWLYHFEIGSLIDV